MDPKRIIRDLTTEIVSRNYSKDTLNSYSSCMMMFCDYFNTVNVKEHPLHINQTEIKEFLAWVLVKYSVCQERQCYWAIKFWYVEIEHQLHKMDGLRPPKIHKKVHCALDANIVLKKIERVKDIKHKAILTLLLGTGLRRSEAAHVRLCDVDSKNGVIYVRLGKGGKDRIVPLPENLLHILREYIKDCRKKNRTPKEWLFETSSGWHISSDTIYDVCKMHLGTWTHRIRKTFATDYYRNTKDLIGLRDILGHKDTRTTEIYISNDPMDLQGKYNPLNKMNMAEYIPNNIYPLQIKAA